MYRVRWDRVAVNELAAFWMQAPPALRNVITAAANRVDQALQTSPETKGESRGVDRVFFSLPLAVRFRVYPPDRRVRVLHVWVLTPRS